MQHALVHQKFTHLWCQGNPVLFSYSLDKWESASYAHPGRHCSRLSHRMSLGGGCQPQEGRSDRPVCLVVSPQTCSHTHQQKSASHWRQENDPKHWKHHLQRTAQPDTLAKLGVPCCMIQISDEEERFKKRSCWHWQSVYITEYSDGNMHIATGLSNLQ